MEISVRELIEGAEKVSFPMELLAGRSGLGNRLASSRIQKPGLLLTGLLGDLHHGRVQIFGAAEVGFLNSLPEDELDTVQRVLTGSEIPAIIVTRSIEAPRFLVDFCETNAIPIFSTSLTSSVFIESLIEHLEERLAPSTTVHGVLLDVLGVGILLVGKSGIGKSECALDLIARGYRLVADDVVTIKKLPPGVLFGTSSEIMRYYMEIRGLGIVNVKDIYGITAIRRTKQMDLVIELVKWEHDGDYERLGFEENTQDILGVGLPFLRIPVSPGRSVATIVEVAARNQILKIMGYRSTAALQKHLDEAIKKNAGAEE